MPYKKINPKWIKELNVKAKTINGLEENVRKNLHDIRFGNDFLDKTTKAHVILKIDELAFIKLKTFEHQRTLSIKC